MGETRCATPERGRGDVNLLLLDADVADHPGPTLRLFLLELRHVRRAAATGQRCSCRYRSLTSGSLSVALTARLSLAMMTAGVFGGALMAFQVSERNPGTPASITVGMSGRSSSLRPGATARILAFPRGGACKPWHGPCS